MNIDIKQLQETLTSLYVNCISVSCNSCPCYNGDICLLSSTPSEWDIAAIIQNIKDTKI